MMSVRVSVVNLFGLYLMFFKDHGNCCADTGYQPPKPSIRRLEAISDEQSLMVSWLVNHSGVVGDTYEIQIGRTERHTIIDSENVTLFSEDSTEHTWTWISDLPLECVDHSVRLRSFYNQSVWSPWSDWKTNSGNKAKDEAEIFPSEQILREGTDPMFCCVPPKGVDITGMAFGKEWLPLLSIGDRVKAILVKNLTIPSRRIDILVISCRETTGKTTQTMNNVSFPPQKPKNLSCATSDMTTVNCTWDPGKKRDPFDVNVQTQTLYIEKSDLAPVNCEQSFCIFPVVPQLQEYSIRVVVKNKLGEEAESYSFNISDRVFPFVERVVVRPGVTEATVSWSVPGNFTQGKLLCQVSAVPHGITELSCDSPCKVKLEHLLPNTKYSARVRCSVDGKHWGDQTKNGSFTTYPLVTLDLWRRVQSDSHSRHVTLLWKPRIVGTAAKVNIQGYTVQWSQEGQTWTESKDSGQTQAKVTIGPGRWDFAVQAVLHPGSSIPAHITIPPVDHTEKVRVRRLSGTTAGDLYLSWEKHSTVTCGYTVEWGILGNEVPGTLQWMKVPDGNNTLFLPARNFKAGHRYTFNIYGCTENEHRLLEIQTGYSKELKSVRAPVLVEPVQSTSSSVTLEWYYDENDLVHTAFITGYLVTVQEAGPDTPTGQAANFVTVSVADPHRKSVTIEALQQDQEYVFSVSALTEEGPGLPVNITIRTRTNYSAHLAKILTPIFLLLGCSVLLWPQRKMLKSGLKHIFGYPSGMNIKAPELDSFLHETDQRLQSLKMEECICCDIEIVNIRPPPPNETADYCPQSATLFLDRPALQQITSITNESYFYTLEENFFEQQEVKLGEIRSSTQQPSDCLQESCPVIYGYISSDIS